MTKKDRGKGTREILVVLWCRIQLMVIEQISCPLVMLGKTLMQCTARLRCAMVSAKQTRNLAEIVNLSASEVSRPPDIRGEPAGRHPAQHPFVKLDFNSPVFT
ncbi:unnamed protein product [Nesidiocoris tenuis]|uniref:Uncharacterized protein n=1 Tax=Nesidiocoris tenuis TaxID=355587 RepID=A0A6H5HLP8_9HEMI|nr:unnamed protein product [Nesidiocoris tenuis]